MYSLCATRPSLRLARDLITGASKALGRNKGGDLYY